MGIRTQKSEDRSQKSEVRNWKSEVRSQKSEIGSQKLEVRNQQRNVMFAKSFEDVEIWKKSHAWVLKIYRLSADFPKHEIYGLTSQLRRAAVSIPANFAEGFKKTGKADKLRFYNIAQG